MNTLKLTKELIAERKENVRKTVDVKKTVYHKNQVLNSV
jgi:hypothetical protein